jgi:hypothetical protein
MQAYPFDSNISSNRYLVVTLVMGICVMPAVHFESSPNHISKLHAIGSG